MLFHKTRLVGAYLIEVEKREDHRGFFARSFCRNEFEALGLNPCIAQANIGFSRSRGTLRGLHYQVPPHAETKIVRCTSGALYDIILDLRPHSPTYREWTGVELTKDAYRMLYVPEGFAHGYLTLADNTEVTYLVSQSYVPNAEQGIRWDDPSFCIAFPIDPVVISEKDRSWPDWYEDIGKGRMLCSP
jgi:dTDP-4-dehydrorhamnose 3,5-epimerase